jgi:hypothetical protein
VEDLGSLLGRLSALFAKVDAFAARVQAAHGDQMACRPGCDGCCRARLSVTPLEAEAIRALLAKLHEPARASLRARAQAILAGPDAPASEVRCVALDEDGRCAIYEARPLVCRSHGVPIRTRDPRGLPVVSACALNFVARGPAAVPAADVLDQETLSTVLFALDAALAQARGGRPGARVDLVTLFA